MNAEHSGSPRVLTVPRRAMVVLIGASGSGKSTFAQKHFAPFQIVSSDYCRGVVSDDEADQSATRAAFDLLHYIVDKRLEGGKLTVVDATNVEVQARRGLLSLARDYHFAVVGIVFDVDLDVAIAQNSLRHDRQTGAGIIRLQHQELRTSKAKLSKEGFSRIFVLKNPEEINAVKLVIES